jgi:hypothetical protein
MLLLAVQYQEKIYIQQKKEVSVVCDCLLK